VYEEILRLIEEEGLLDGIDLENLHPDQEDELSERIAAAYRERHRRDQKTRSALFSSGERPLGGGLHFDSPPRRGHEKSNPLSGIGEKILLKYA
jgi:hypothetical protein